MESELSIKPVTMNRSTHGTFEITSPLLVCEPRMPKHITILDNQSDITLVNNVWEHNFKTRTPTREKITPLQPPPNSPTPNHTSKARHTCGQDRTRRDKTHTTWVTLAPSTTHIPSFMKIGHCFLSMVYICCCCCCCCC